MNETQKTDRDLYIRCGGTVFVFPLKETDDAWYCLDGRESRTRNASLRINADRDVYAVYTDPAGIKHYGTVGDEENEAFADNCPVNAGDQYIFRENPKTEKYYI